MELVDINITVGSALYTWYSEESINRTGINITVGSALNGEGLAKLL